MKNKAFTIVEMLVVALAGVILLFNPGGSLETVTKILGVALLIFGVFSLLKYLMAKERGAGDAITAAIAVVLGLILLIAPRALASVLPIVAGVVIIIAGIRGIAGAFASRKSSRSWILSCVFSIVTLILGVVILCNPFSAAKSVVMVLGVVLIYIGVTGVIAAVKA